MSSTALLKNPMLSLQLSPGEEEELRQATIAPFELLLLACRSDSVELAEAALTRGADVNMRDRESWTPLMHAAYHNCWKVIPLLIRRRAVLHLRDDQGESPLDIAKAMDCNLSLKELEQALDKNRLKQAGLFLQALNALIQEKSKPRERQSKSLMAWSYIDLGYGWWLMEERMDKCFGYFRKAASLAPSVGSFPYASLLASCGYPDEAMTLLFKIARRRWGAISRKSMENDQAFHSLFDHPDWNALMRIWPAD